METALRFLTAAALMLSAQAFAQTPPPGVYMTMGSQLIGILTDGSYCMVVQNDVKNGDWQETPDGLQLDDGKTVIADNGSGGYTVTFGGYPTLDKSGLYLDSLLPQQDFIEGIVTATPEDKTDLE